MTWRIDAVITAVAVVVLAAAVLGGAWWLWWRLPKRQVDRLRLTIRDPKARAELEDNYRKTIGQLLGGAAVLIGAALAYLQFTQQIQASRDLLISNQVSKGFEQLGSHESVGRLAGIYALEGVMNTSKQYYQPILEALCGFVRVQGVSGIQDQRAAQAALTVIGRRNPIGTGTPDLSNANIPNADLRDANLSGARLMLTTLVGADLRGANLRSADLSDADLSGAKLGGAKLDGAILSGAKLGSSSFGGADLRASNITQAQLDQACGTNVKLDPGLTIRPCPER